MRCSCSMSTARLSRKMLARAWPAIWASDGCRVLPLRSCSFMRPAPMTRDAFGAQGGWRGDRSQLTHRPVAEEFAIDMGGGKDEGDGARRQQVIDVDLATNAEALDAAPGFGRRVALEESDAFAGFVSGGGDGQRMEGAGSGWRGRRRGNPGIDSAIPQGELSSRERDGCGSPSRRRAWKASGPGTKDSRGVGAIDVAGMHAAPDVATISTALPKLSARQATLAALMAPADVPHRMGKGFTRDWAAIPPPRSARRPGRPPGAAAGQDEGGAGREVIAGLRNAMAINGIRGRCP